MIVLAFAFAFMTTAVYSWAQGMPWLQGKTIGTVNVTNVYPSTATSDGWDSVSNLLSPAVNDEALYQRFSTKNAAFYPPLPVAPAPSVTENTAATDTEQTSPEPDENTDAAAGESASADQSEPAATKADEDTIETETDPETESVQSEESEQAETPEDVSAAMPATASVWTVFTRLGTMFPFANEQATLVEDTGADDPTTDGETPTESDVSVATDTESTTDDEVPVTDTDADDTTNQVSEPGANEEEASTTVPTDDTQMTGDAVEDGTVADEQTESSELDTVQAESVSVDTTASDNDAATTTDVNSDTNTPSITTAGFALPPLAAGEFIKSTQLRVSLAARMHTPSNDYRLQFIARTASSSQSIGAVILDEEEVSNAINGGYFLFPFIPLTDVAELDDIEIEVRYIGDTDAVETIYIDSLWLELETERITKSDLVNARSASELAHLRRPTKHDLISTERSFVNEDQLTFNLRYESQRSAPVQALRGLFGRSKVELVTARVIHKGVGEIPITPEVNVTSDGLVSVAIADKDKASLRPGQYEIELVMQEGSVQTVDSFDFQWGILSVNSDQTQYELGQTADISLGAITPNGNTLCNANLRLFAIAPDEGAIPVPVSESGQCNGNNVIDVPDYSANFVPEHLGEYELYVERLDDAGELIGHTAMTFSVVEEAPLQIRRVGPTRIYPPAAYPMELTVTASEAFTGTVTEQVPAGFVVFATDAEVRPRQNAVELTWDVALQAGESTTLSYQFDAPDLSPYLYELGPAALTAASSGLTSTTSSSSRSTSEASTFTEHRQWQIASDAVGNMIMFWPDDTTIPAGWSCLSCGSGTMFERFVRGSNTYNTTGGALTHGHTGTGSVQADAGSGAVENRGGADIAANDHTHTFTPTIGTASNLPSYRTLRVIQYTASAGEPATIPAGAIGIFDDAVPAGWTRYAAQDGYYVYGADTVGTTGGADTHTHSLSGTVTAAGGATLGTRGGGTQVSGAAAGHTHTVTGSTPATSNEPPYIEVILGEIDTAGPPPVGMITMWTEDVPAGWVDVSSAGTEPFNGRFIKAAASYGTTGGSESHTEADVTGLTSSAANAAATGRSGAFGSLAGHTHTVGVTSFSTESHLPPFTTAVFGKRIGLDPVFTQANYRWYVNEDAQTPSDPWAAGVAIDLLENEAITATSTPIKAGDRLRLRMNALVGNATSTVGTATKLQYSEASVCSSASGWTDVGAAGSGAKWRGYDNGSVADSSTLGSTLLASTTAAFTYQENGSATGTPVGVAVDGYGEWDFVLENNGATAGANYCFRQVYDDGATFFAYDNYPQVVTNSAPDAYELIQRFDNENLATTSTNFQFLAVDPEGDKVNYQIQIATDVAFSSVVIDKNSISDALQFENQVLNSEKNPFTSGQRIEFINDTALSDGQTYWWRIRATDPGGSDEWGGWSDPDSFTITTSLNGSGWLQREDEQFDRGTLSGVETSGSDTVRLETGTTTGTIVSPTIDFNLGERGTAWEQVRFTDDTTNGSISYQVEYRNEAGEWTLIPDGDLTGNSAGYTTSPINLLALDTDTYRFIRLRATLTDGGGSPLLQDWAVDWGFRVETPSITSPFANEKVGSTTPTFIFSTTDPQADDLTYQIEWSTDPSFATGVTTRTSDTDAGFENLDSGGDTDPFISGDAVIFTVQSADALTNTETYWWRVRAKDTTGDNEYSFWSDARSLTVDNTVVTSTWFQTTEEQFGSNILSGTTGVSGGVTVSTVAQEAMIVYGEGTVTTPRYRIWNGSNWSSEESALDINSSLRWVVNRAATTREEYIATTVGANGHVIAQVFALGEWDDQQTMTTTVGSTASRGFDTVYETVSGDALVVYCDGDSNPSYRMWDGSTWSAEATITTSFTDDCRWIELAADPTTNEVVALMRGVSGDPYEVQVWDGSVWGNASTFGASRVSTYGGLAVEYEESGGQAVAVAPSPGGGPNRMVYNVWNGTTWTGETTQTISGRLYWAGMARAVGNDDMVLCYINDANDVQAIRWDGAGWVGDTQFTATVNNVADPGFACAFENTAGREGYILGTYSDTTATQYRTWNTAAWSGAAAVNSIVQSATMELQRTGNNVMLGSFLDYNNTALRFAEWDGTGWDATITLEDDISVTTSPYGLPYSTAPRNPGSEGSVVVSPAINFSDGLGPYWDEFSWNETTPGSSVVTYSMQYFDGSSWQFIPDSDLPGNEAGFTTGPVDLSNLNISTYGTIRPYAELTCDGASNCPTITDWSVTWAEGISISGSLDAYDTTTAITSGSVEVAVNGVLQIGKTGSVSAGQWSIDNVTAFAGDVLTVFVSGAADAAEAVGVSLYDGVGNVTGLQLYERHLALGSDVATSTAITNSDLGLYTVAQTEDVFFSVATNTLTACADTGCDDVRLFVNASTTYAPGGDVSTHDVDIDGTLSSADTLTVRGSWQNQGTSSLAGGTVELTALTGTEFIDVSGAQQGAFGNLTIGTTSSAATYELQSDIEVSNTLTTAAGTFNRAGYALALTDDLAILNGSNWSGLGTTTFLGTGVANWSDANVSKQNTGYVEITGSPKTVILADSVKADSVYIGADATLDASNSNYDIEVVTDWVNQNNFTARNGTVSFIATSSAHQITRGASAFANLTIAGNGATWSFTEPSLELTNTLTITEGTLNLPSATTTIGGSFANTGGTFAHNNGLVVLNGSGANSITQSATAFTNAFYDLSFTGSGSWTYSEANATTSNTVRIKNGTVTLPATSLAVGNSFIVDGGTAVASGGEVRMFADAAATITTDGSALATVRFVGSGPYTFAEAETTLTDDIRIDSGVVTLPSSDLLVGNSFINTSSFMAGTGTVSFIGSQSGQTIAPGVSSFHAVEINGAGAWTMVESATTTDAFTLNSAGGFTVQSGNTLAVQGAFTNAVGGASTTWSGSTLLLDAGTAYDINTKLAGADQYGTLAVEAGTQVDMWNSSADTFAVSGAVYSKDHASTDGLAHIYGDYALASSSVYWSYATDFDGTDLSGGSERAASVAFASGAAADFTDSVLEITGTASATTTISNQGSGQYEVTMRGGTTTATYYAWEDLGGAGLSLFDGAVVPSLSNGSFTVGEAAASALTLSSTTISANPAKQIFAVDFATTSAIAATNVTQTDGDPGSYWWFRNGGGNLYGEAYDNDTGNPGSVRFDDSSLVLTISGTVYSDAGSTPQAGGICDDSTNVVELVVAGDTTYSGACSSADGSFSISGVVVTGDPTITGYLNTNGGTQAVTVTKTPTANISDFDLYQNRVIVRHEDESPLTIADMAVFDTADDADIAFTAATGTTPVLQTQSGTELFVWASSTFTPQGTVTLGSDGQSNTYDGSLVLAGDASFDAYATSTVTIGGRLALAAGASFAPASSTVLFTATTTGKGISATDAIDFYTLRFDGTGGGWNLATDIVVDQDLEVTAGTVTGTGDILVREGSFSGDGVVSLGSGTTTIRTSNTLGGTSPWTFANLQLGTGAVAGTTTPAFATTTVLDTLTIATAHFLDAQSSYWNLDGQNDVLDIQGTLLPGTSTFRYSGDGAAVVATTYYNLVLDAAVGPATYTADIFGIVVDNDLQVGGTSDTTFTLATNNPALSVAGDVQITSNGTLEASASGNLEVAGSWLNDGSFVANNGTVQFVTAGTETIAAGASDFASVVIDAAGALTVTEHATATARWQLANHSLFTVASGVTLAVQNEFLNQVGGAATDWSGATLALYGGATFNLNASTTADSYDTLAVRDTAQVRTWNSDASTYNVANTASVYSQDHAGVDGALHIYGRYEQLADADYWSYATDFDGTDLTGGAERAVTVSIADAASLQYTGGTSEVRGAVGASTTIQNQGTGSYELTLGGLTDIDWNRVVVRNIAADGVVIAGTPTVTDFSRTDHIVTTNNATAVTVGGTAITANPAKNYTNNIFTVAGGVTGARNVTATGTTDSSWRFTNHSGDLSGEAFDDDPAGDPGYVVWDDSAALITISGNVYSDEGSTVSSVCDGSTQNVTLVVAGLTTYTTSCAAASGAYSISDVAYGPTDTLSLYLSGEAVQAANITTDPVTSIGTMDLYENRVIVRHENTDPISIADIAVWDSGDDADVPFSTTGGASDTLTLSADHKLIVWNNKTFAPGGDVTVSGGGGGASYDGSFEAYTGATFAAANGETHTIGGSFEFATGATLVAAESTITLTSTQSGRTVTLDDAPVHNLEFTGSGTWTITDPTLSVTNQYLQSAGTVTWPTGTTTFAGSVNVTGGSFIHTGLPLQFTSTATGNTVAFNGSSVAGMNFAGAGGSWSMTDGAATSTASFTIASGTVTLPSGTLAVEGSFRNAGSIDANNGELHLLATSSELIELQGSDVHRLRLSNGEYTFVDSSASILDDFIMQAGASTTLATGTTAVGGSFTATDGGFAHSSGTVLFNSTATGNTITPGASPFYTVVLGSVSGGWTLASATTTNNFSLVNANDFTLQSGATLSIGGIFKNNVGGAATTWNGSTVELRSGLSNRLNDKSDAGDEYDTLVLSAGTTIDSWYSRATTTTVDSTASWYSRDHDSVDGLVHVYGDFTIATTTEYWSYATDFDGTDLSGGSERQVTVAHADQATTTLGVAGTLYIEGAVGNETVLTNQGSGTYGMRVTAGTITAQDYQFRNLNTAGWQFSGTPTITALDRGDMELAVDTGSLMTLSSTTLNANASLVINGSRFATTSAISGTNVTLVGSTANAWTFVGHTGNLSGEAYDIDGVSACGSLRWDDSKCLLTQQVHYRWRNDDGTLAVPTTEWFDTAWQERVRVRLQNTDPNTYSDAAVHFTLDYNSEMQSDFSDLVVTAADGVTELPFWIERVDVNTEADVWVKTDTLGSNSTESIFVYYGNGAASNRSSSTAVFTVVDDFEDNSLSEYSGDTTLFTPDASLTYGGSYGLSNAGNTSARADNGIARFDQTISQGDTIRYRQYVDTASGSGDEVCTMFAVQSPVVTNKNYAICIEQFDPGTDRISIAKDVENVDLSGTVLASTTVAYTTGWYEVIVDWADDGDIAVTLEQAGSSVATVSTNDTSYTSGGYGFTYWFNHGGWDNFIAYPSLTTDPVVYFGTGQTYGGASWAAALDTTADQFVVNDTARLRLLVENSGLEVTNQTYELEYAAQGTAPSCESVAPATYSAVPTQTACGTSPTCMVSSTNVTDGAGTTDLLESARGQFVAGYAVADPSNTATALTIDQNEYTEHEYVVTLTENVVDQNLCFRVTNSGSELDSYLRVARLSLKFDPVVTNVIFNDGFDISLLPGTTTRVYATSTVTDLNGYEDITNATTTFFTSAAGAACAPDDNDCYIATTDDQCSLQNCSGNSCDLVCYADFAFHANPTDDIGSDWFAFAEAEDESDALGFATSGAIDVSTLRALSVLSDIDYGALAPNSDTGSVNASTTVQNIGNNDIDVEIEGTNLEDGFGSSIPVSQQRFATSTFTYSSCTNCTSLSTASVFYPVGLNKPTSITSPVATDIYWGIAIPYGVPARPHSGTNTFYAVGG